MFQDEGQEEVRSHVADLRDEAERDGELEAPLELLHASQWVGGAAGLAQDEQVLKEAEGEDVYEFPVFARDVEADHLYEDISGELLHTRVADVRMVFLTGAGMRRVLTVLPGRWCIRSSILSSHDRKDCLIVGSGSGYASRNARGFSKARRSSIVKEFSYVVGGRGGLGFRR